MRRSHTFPAPGLRDRLCQPREIPSFATHSFASGPTPHSQPATPMRSCGAGADQSRRDLRNRAGASRLALGPITDPRVRAARAAGPRAAALQPPIQRQLRTRSTPTPPPFNDVRVRQALNYAINRNKIVQLYGGRAWPLQLASRRPGLPGYRRYCPYTLNPKSDGPWSAPDMARARGWSRRSGTSGIGSSSGAAPTSRFTPPAITEYFACRAALPRLPRPPAPLPRRGHHKSEVEAIPCRSPMKATGLRPSPTHPPTYRILQLQRGQRQRLLLQPGHRPRNDRAEQLDPADPAKSRKIWQAVDRRLTDGAEWVPTVNQPGSRDHLPTATELRVQPGWGFLADQAWVAVK